MAGVTDFTVPTGISLGPNEVDNVGFNYGDVGGDAIAVMFLFGPGDASEAIDDHWTAPAGWLAIPEYEAGGIASTSPISNARAFAWYRIGPFSGVQTWTCDEDRVFGAVTGIIQCDETVASVDWQWDIHSNGGQSAVGTIEEAAGGGWGYVTNPGHAAVVIRALAAAADGESGSAFAPEPILDIDGMTLTLPESSPGSDGLAVLGYWHPFTGPAFTEYGRIYLAYDLLADGVDLPGLTRTNEWSSPGNTIYTASFQVCPKITFGEPEPEGTPVVAIRCGVNELDLGPDFAAWGDEGEWSTVANGGFDSFTLRIPAQVYRDNVDALGWGAEVAVYLPSDDEYDPGELVWAGTLVEPAVDPEADHVTLEAVGWAVLLEERDDPLMWSAWGPRDFRPAEGAPWTYDNADSIRVDVEDSQIVFSVNKGDDVAGGDIVRAGMWAEGHVIRQVAGTLRSNISTANYEPTLWTQASPEEPLTAVEDHSFTDIDSGATPFDVTLDDPQGAAFFQLERTDGGTSDAARLRFRIDDLRVRDLADSDDYTVGDSMEDVCELAGLDPVGIQLAAFDLATGPLWWDSGSWAELMDYLALARGNPWFVWEKTEVGPRFEYKPFGGVNGGPVWYVKAYGDDAECTFRPTRTQDVYTHVDVRFKLVGEVHWRHRRATVDLEEVGPCATGRVRVLRIDMPDPQPDATKAEQLRDSLADELATQDFSAEFILGPVRDEDDVLHNPSMVRSGARLYVEDFPNPDGSFGRYFRIYSTRYDQMSRQSTVQGGRVPAALARFQFWQERKAARMSF